MSDHLLQARQYLTCAAAELNRAWAAAMAAPGEPDGDDALILILGHDVLDTLAQLDALMRARTVYTHHGGIA